MKTRSFEILTENCSPQNSTHGQLGASRRDPIGEFLNEQLRKDPIGFMRKVGDVFVAFGVPASKLGAAIGLGAGWGLNVIEQWAKDEIGWSEWERRTKEFNDRHDKNGDGKVESGRDYEGFNSGGAMQA